MRVLLTLLVPICFLGSSVGANAQGPATADRVDRVLEELREIRLLIRSMEQRTDGTGKAGPDEVVEFTIPDVARLGSRDAPVTIVEFLDYGCAFCRQFVDLTFSDLKERYIDTALV